MKWFIYEKNKSHGPFTFDQIKELCSSKKLSDKALIYGRVLGQWMSKKQWLNSADKINDLLNQLPKAKQWHYSKENQSFGPFLEEELIKKLYEYSDHSGIQLWTSGIKDWLPLHKFPDIMGATGVNQRVSSRFPLKGQLK